MSVKTISNTIQSSTSYNVSGNTVMRCRYSGVDTHKILNERFYVSIFDSDEIMKKAAECIVKYGYISAIPIMNEDDRYYHETCVRVDNTTDLNEQVSKFEKIINEISETIEVTNATKFVITELVDKLNDAVEFFKSETKESENADSIYINIKDSVYNQHRCIVTAGNINRNLFEACMNKITASKTDYQLNFGTKVTGTIGVSFGECPLSFGDYLCVQIPGGTSTLNLESYKLAYLGSIFTEELFEDYSKLRFALDIEFKPLNKTFATTKESFEHYSSIIDQTKEKNPSKIFANRNDSKLLCKLSNIKLSVSGSLANETIVENIVESLTLAICTVSETANISEIRDKVMNKLSEKISHDHDYDLSLDVEDIFKDIEFNIITW